MSKMKAFILVAFVLAMGAGVAVGMLSTRTRPHPGDGRMAFVQELQLTADQQVQMKAIWDEMMESKGRQFGEEYRAIQHEREVSLQAILNTDQKSQAQAIDEKMTRQLQELGKRCQQDFEAASARTRALLTAPQQVKFDAMMERFRSQREHMPWFAAGPGPSTAPAAISQHD